MQTNQPIKKNPTANLQTEIEILFHSEYAINLIEGTVKNDDAKSFFIIGLIGFSSKLKIVKRDCDRHNPYAKYFYQQSIEKFDEAKKLIDEMDGSIVCRSNPKSGTQFQILLPKLN